MITTVTLNPAIDREYFVEENKPKKHQYIYSKQNIKVTPGGKGLLSAIDLKQMGYSDVQNIGFIGGSQGRFFEQMVQDYRITTNYIHTTNEMRNNIKIIGKSPVSHTYYNDYTFKVTKNDVEALIKRFKSGITDSDLILIAGSIPKGVDLEIYRKLISICHVQGKEVFLQASGEALNLALKEKPKFISPYFKHTDKILGEKLEEEGDYFRLGRRLVQEGAQYVTLPFHCKRILFTQDKTYLLSPENFCLKNWVGASDAYNAGFFDYIYQTGFDFVEANRHGGAAALYVAENKSNFINEEWNINSFLDRIKIEEMEENNGKG